MIYLCTLHNSFLTISKCMKMHAVSSDFYLNHSQNEDNGQGNEISSHFILFEGQDGLKRSIYKEYFEHSRKKINMNLQRLQLIRGSSEMGWGRRNQFSKMQKIRFRQFQICKYSRALACWFDLNKKSLTMHEQEWMKITRWVFPTDSILQRGQKRLNTSSWFFFRGSYPLKLFCLGNNLLQILIHISWQVTQLRFVEMRSAAKVFFDIFYISNAKKQLNELHIDDLQFFSFSIIIGEAGWTVMRKNQDFFDVLRFEKLRLVVSYKIFCSYANLCTISLENLPFWFINIPKVFQADLTLLIRSALPFLLSILPTRSKSLVPAKDPA